MVVLVLLASILPYITLLLFLYSSGHGKYRREFDARPGDGKSHFTKSRNPFFTERRRSFPTEDRGERRGVGNRRERGTPYRSLFHELSSSDRDDRGMGKWGKERGHRSSIRNKRQEDRFEDDFMDDEVFDDFK